MPSMFQRLLPRPNRSAFLLGPRGTGKSTWIQEQFPQATRYDLLNTQEALRLSKEPGLLYQELKGLPADSWVVLDEVQKVPSLLDEVQRLMEENKLRFLLCGSSARKLKKGGANLLAGRALHKEMFPLVSAEVGFDLNVMEVLRSGLLPLSFEHSDYGDYLRAYVNTYLQEEIKAEALARNIGSFARFLEVAARQNGQLTNVQNISRDAQVARQTVQGFFEILQDTLLGIFLPAWKLKRATKQVAHPKFYFFDPGVVRALLGRLPYPPTPEELGPALETWVLGELRAYLHYRGYHYPLYFWRSHGGVEVDFFCEDQKGFVAIEVKSARRWDRKWNLGFHRMQEKLGSKKVRTWGIFLGERALESEGITVMPVVHFFRELWANQVMI